MGSPHRRPPTVGKAPALVPDIVLLAEVPVRVAVRHLVEGILEGGEGNHLLGLSYPLTMESTSAGKRYSRERRPLFGNLLGGDFPIFDGWGSAMTEHISLVPPGMR